MRVYLDLCCLKRPFDAQDQVMVRLETEAILTILTLRERIHLLRSAAHHLENDFNPLQARREAVAVWLVEEPHLEVAEDPLRARTEELMALGFKGFDALHLASAEGLSADIFLTVDQALLKRAARLSTELRLRVLDPIDFVQEISWTN